MSSCIEERVEIPVRERGRLTAKERTFRFAISKVWTLTFLESLHESLQKLCTFDVFHNGTVSFGSVPFDASCGSFLDRQRSDAALRQIRDRSRSGAE